jgi:hypothetical protein
MYIPRPQLNEITECVEDTIQYLCDEHMLSGELMWTIVETLAQAKLAELDGKIPSVTYKEEPPR